MKNLIIVYVIFAVICFIINCIALVKNYSSGGLSSNWWFYPMLVILGLIVSILWPLSVIVGIITVTIELRKLRQGVK